MPLFATNLVAKFIESTSIAAVCHCVGEMGGDRVKWVVIKLLNLFFK